MSGPRARTIAGRVFRAKGPLCDRVATLGTVVSEDGSVLDRGLALLFAGPRSYTGEDVVEFHVHGSSAVARDTLLATLAAGARLASPGEFTRRAFLAGKMDLSAAEAVADLIEAEQRSVARAAATRLSGGLQAAVERQAALLGAIVEELAAALDFPDEVGAPAPQVLATRLDAVDAALEELAATWEQGRVVREGLSIAIVGPPNVGKSSLLNALLGTERALVSKTAGTTRDSLEETLALGGGIVARVIDTAGLRAGGGRLERAGIARSEAALAGATVALVVVDGSKPLPREGHDLLRRTRQRDRLVFYNKRDLGSVAYAAREPAEAGALFGSAHDGASVEAVHAALGRIAGSDRIDLARPHLGTARQADAVLEARRSLAFARETMAAGQPIDLIAGDVMAARAALSGLTGRDADESLLDGIFARFCIGK